MSWRVRNLRENFMSNALKVFFVAALLCLITTYSYAHSDDIVWKQPAATFAPRQNLHFEGNATLRKADVRKLQEALSAKGFYKGGIDGIWGGQTSQAILDYQALHQQPLTGTLTVETLQELGVRVKANR